MEDINKMLVGASEKSYGVRSEIRGSGSAIKAAIRKAPEKVSVCSSCNLTLNA
jgi:hypothetical protein